MGDAPLPAPRAGPRAPLLQRVTHSQLVVFDLVLGSAVLLVCLWEVARAHQIALGAACLLVAGPALGVRRRYPSLSLVVMTAAVALSTAAGVAAFPSPLLALPVYQVASTRERRRSLGSFLMSVAVVLLGVAVGRANHVAIGASAFTIVVSVAAWFVGDSVRARRTYVAGIAEQAALRHRETVERAQRALAEERLRIARELHDVVAHSLSVIAVQSGVGRHVIEEDPVEAKRALRAVETTSRAALQELRRLLGVLRSDTDTGALAPAPGLAGLGQLAEQVRGAGIPVDLRVAPGAAWGLSPGAELTVYRVVQEALTNVVKHAGPATARVVVAEEPGTLVVEVEDDGCGPVPALYTTEDPGPTGHHGIVGMRERVALFGGALEAGYRPEGGFRVMARFPRAAVTADGGAPGAGTTPGVGAGAGVGIAVP